MQHLSSLPHTPLPVTGAVQTIAPHFFNTYIKWRHNLFTFKVSWKEFCMYFLCHIYAACYITCLFHNPRFHYSNHFWWKLPIMKPLTKQWSAALCCFHILMSKYSTQQFSKTPSQRLLSSMRQVLNPYTLTCKCTHILFQPLRFQIAGSKAKDYAKACSKHYINFLSISWQYDL